MLAHFNIMPVGTGEETKELTTKAVRIVDKSELPYQLTSMGIIVEGEWDEVIFLMKKCFQEVKKRSDRVVMSVTIDDRKDLRDRLKNNVLEVEYAVGGNLQTMGLT